VFERIGTYVAVTLVDRDGVRLSVTKPHVDLPGPKVDPHHSTLTHDQDDSDPTGRSVRVPDAMMQRQRMGPRLSSVIVVVVLASAPFWVLRSLVAQDAGTQALITVAQLAVSIPAGVLFVRWRFRVWRAANPIEELVEERVQAMREAAPWN
jgi:hypothetical protein